MELSTIIENYKNNHNQENYNKVLLNLFSDINNTLILPSKARKDNDGFDLKSIYDNNGMYLVVYTNGEFIEKNDEVFIKMTIKGIIEKILETEKCLGICINPDLNINDNNMMKQCIIPKEHIIRLLNS